MSPALTVTSTVRDPAATGVLGLGGGIAYPRRLNHVTAAVFGCAVVAPLRDVRVADHSIRAGASIEEREANEGDDAARLIGSGTSHPARHPGRRWRREYRRRP